MCKTMRHQYNFCLSVCFFSGVYPFIWLLFNSCNLIKNKIDLSINFRNTQKLIFDFSGVNFLDSSGIGMVMGRYKSMLQNGGKTAVVGLKPTVRKIFNMSGLFKILDEYDNVENALNQMKQLV